MFGILNVRQSGRHFYNRLPSPAKNLLFFFVLVALGGSVYLFVKDRTDRYVLIRAHAMLAEYYWQLLGPLSLVCHRLRPVTAPHVRSFSFLRRSAATRSATR